MSQMQAIMDMQRGGKTSQEDSLKTSFLSVVELSINSPRTFDSDLLRAGGFGADAVDKESMLRAFFIMLKRVTL